MNPLEEYINLIHYWQQNPCKVKGEIHHIIPQSLGGPDEEWNMVRMPTLDHIKCHKLLKRIYKGKNSTRMGNAYTFMRRTRKGIVLTDEEAAEARDAQHSPHDDEWNRHISEALAGKSKTDEARANMSKNHADVNGVNNPFYGKHHTEETKQRNRMAHLGKTHPGYTKGMHWTLDEECRRRRSEKMKEYWERRRSKAQ